MPDSTMTFESAFHALTGNPPFPWQIALYQRFIADGPDNIPKSCNLPTGLGKTSVIAIWLIALATHPHKMPRRLVYVVNRRTVVDQTTDEVTNIRARLIGEFGPPPAVLWELRKRLQDPLNAYSPSPLAISTLRGQFADNREWSADPSRPAIICGTVDMIGSRLLFSGYGVGFKGKPLHAGFLGQDVLLVHDEAHLEPAFQKLIEDIEIEQRDKERSTTFAIPRLRVMELSATSRGNQKPFELTPEEKMPPKELPSKPTEPIHFVWLRTHSKKALVLHPIADEKQQLAKTIVSLAERYKASEKELAILVFVRTIENVTGVVKGLTAAKIPESNILTLTGTMRGLERDKMARENGVFAHFKQDSPAPRQPGTVFMICTSAGEVGVDISADHLICDLSTLDSMAQRFGRVNRYGFGNAVIDLVHPTTIETKEKPFEAARERTLQLLQQLRKLPDGKFDACPAAMSDLVERILHDGQEGELTTDQRKEAIEQKLLPAFAPAPTILPTSDILFDAWALTTIKDKLPGRPPVEPYLHGLPTDWQPPETHVAWRWEVERLQPRYRTDVERAEREMDDRRALAKLAAELIDDYPLQPHETLKDNSRRVRGEIDILAGRFPESPVWIVDNETGAVSIKRLSDLAEKTKKDGKAVYLVDSDECTILLPPSVGGLELGMLKGNAPNADDVADTEARVRVDDPNDPKADNMRLVKSVPLPNAGENEEEADYWYWFTAFSEGGKTSKLPVAWDVHVADVVREAKAIVANLPLSSELKNAIIVAAMFHDHGKRRKCFQNVLGNSNYPRIVLAKSGRRSNRLTENYRHEFGSLLDVQLEAEVQNLNAEMKELVLHLIAAHHGRARPHFPEDDAFDPERPHQDVSALATCVPRRFAQLQRKYGRWGLAYLESILRAADWAASSKPSQYLEDEQ